MKTYSVVIPVFRGTKSISKIVSDLKSININIVQIIFVFDNGDLLAWEEIKKHPSVTLSIDAFYFGLVFFREEVKEKVDLRFYL